MVTELLQKYIWLVNTFVRAGEYGLSLTELSERWENRFDSPYSRRTFNNHREAVEEVFGIRIGCNRSSNRYFIEYSDDISDDGAETAWLINTFTVNNMLSLGKERLSGRISVEDIPSGHMHLTTVMEAMTENHEIVIEYKKYTSAASDRYTLRPYALKEFAKRWYLVGYCLERSALRVYGLDRITGLEVSDRTFKMPRGFDVDELFATSFGIYLAESRAETIRFRVHETEARYLRDLPIHSSQKELHSNHNDNSDKQIIFEIFTCPNTALIMEFCKRGSRIEVLSPEHVREAVATELLAAASQYTQNQ